MLGRQPEHQFQFVLSLPLVSTDLPSSLHESIMAERMQERAI